MYEVYKFDNEWQVHTSYDGAYAGSFKEIMKFCMKEIRVPAYELEAAVATMEQNGHNAIHFGVNRTFIYSFTKYLKKQEN